jgi:hypothetical protein
VAIAVTETQRFEMHASLRKLMGEEVANTMMEHLPPFGWADVARRSDIDRLDARIDKLVAAMWAVGGIFTTCFIGLFTLIATKL